MFNVLFLCTGNSARSVMAEALLNHLAGPGGKFKAYSAGSQPKGEVNPLALKTLEVNRLPSTGFRSKSWDEFSGPDAPEMSFVITLCDSAAAEVCPIWPGHPLTAHWGVPDPAAVTGTKDDQRRAFQDALVILRRRVELLLNLPLETLNRLAIHRHIKDIGNS